MGKAKPVTRNVFCLEGDWEKDLKDTISVQPALELLKRVNKLDFIYKTCSTAEEFTSRLDHFFKNKTTYKKYGIVYLAFHGYENGLQLNHEKDLTVTLDDLMYRYEGKFSNKIIHFGSCRTLNVSDQQLKKFVKTTDAMAVSGYSLDTEFLSGTALDILFFEMCQQFKTIESIENNMLKYYGELCEKMEFKMYYQKSK